MRHDDPTHSESRGRGKLRGLGFLAVVALLIVWLVFFWGKQRKAWTEEVVLADGSKIEVERRLTLEKTYYELFQAGLKPTFQRLRLPDGVTFETEDRLILLHLERGDAPVRWALLAAPAFCATYDKFNRPEPPYIQFEYDGNGWNFRTVEPKHFGKTVNLLVSDKGIENDAHVLATSKPDLNSTWKGIARSYLTIDGSKSLREACALPTYGGQK